MAKTNIILPASFYEEEKRGDTLVSKDTKRLWAVELDLFQELKRVCEKHNIKFFAISGTLIGAARHHGFIPWDDDIDVVMLRSEYKKLENVASEFIDPYFFQTNYTDPGSLRGHAQLRNSSTTAILENEIYNGVPLGSFNQGIFLDIFPLDKLPNDLEERKTFMETLIRLKNRIKLLKYYRSFLHNWYRYPKSYKGLKVIVHGIIQKMTEMVSRKDFLADAYKEFDGFAQKYNQTDSRECSPITFSQRLRQHEVFNVSDFDEHVELDFEMFKIPCPKNYDEVLTRAFGNWRTPVIGKNTHGHLMIDLDKSYRDYLR